MKNLITLFILSLISLNCKKSEENQILEFNKMINSILKYETENRKIPENIKFNVSSNLNILKVYIPSEQEINGEIPGPPSRFNKNIVRLLDLKNDKKTKREKDSIKLLNQEEFKIQKVIIDKKINKNINIITTEATRNSDKLFAFTNPIYLDENNAYIETEYFDHGFGIGFGYLIQKDKDGNWNIIKQINTFIT